MEVSAREVVSYSFGSFELFPRTGELRKHGKPIRIAPQPFGVLVVLVERAGDVVTRQELRDLNWGDQVVVDFEMGLNRCIRRVRAALMDDADSPRYLETVPKVGYRFIAPVRIEGIRDAPIGTPITLPDVDSPAVTRESPTGVDPIASVPPRVPEPTVASSALSKVLNRSSRPLSAALFTMLMLAALMVWLRSGSRHDFVKAQFTPEPLDDELGIASTPSFSPEGQEIAFSWNGEKQDNFDIYVKMVGSPALIRLTTDRDVDFSPAWSPDGRSIAFCRGKLDGKSAIWITSPLGGPERKIVDLNAPAEIGYRVLTWTPDGRFLVYADVAVPDRTGALFVVNVDTGNKRQLTFPPDGSVDVHPAFAPDGHATAFARDSGRGVSSIQILPMHQDWTAAGTPQKMAWSGFENVTCGRPKWTPDSKQLIFMSNRTGEHQLWEARPQSSATPELVASLGTSLEDAAISRDGALALVRSVNSVNIWRLDTAGVLNSRAVYPTRLLASTRTQTNPAVSPDGRKIAFESNRSGFTEVWVANIDGSNAEQLTNLHNPVTGSPSWSHDGTKIAFDSRATSLPAIYVVSSAGGTPIKLTTDSRDVVPSWSTDDKWIYFTSDHSGDSQIWKVASSGGTPKQLSTAGGFAAVPSPDGLFLYYSADRLPGTSLKRLDLNTAQESVVAMGILPRKYSPTLDGIFFVSGDPYGRESLHFYSSKLERSDVVFRFPKRIDKGSGLSLAASQLFYGQVDEDGSDLLLVRRFWQ